MYSFGKSKEFISQKGIGVIVCDNEEQTPNIKVAGSNAQRLKSGDKISASNLVVVKRTKGQIPFGNFTILEYFRYQRALVDERPFSRSEIASRIYTVGLNRSISTKLKRLSPVEFRALTLATKMQEDTTKTFLNFAGLKYCRKNKKLLSNFLSKLDKSFTVFVNLSDTRFVPKKRG